MTEVAPPQDRTKPTPIIDAAIEASRRQQWPAEIYAAARVLCPKEQPAEWIEAIAMAIFPVESDHVWNPDTAWRAQPLWQELWGEP